VITLKEAEKFHGHLGPYLILGLKAGELALQKLKAKKYFGIEIKVFGAEEKPKSCLIDGLQLSTGATYGKGNIKKLAGLKIKISFLNRSNHKKIILVPKDNLLKRLNQLKTEQVSKDLAKELYKIKPNLLFTIKN